MTKAMDRSLEAPPRWFRPYQEYKESGIAWLQGVPKGWLSRRAKLVFREVNDQSTTGEEVLLSVSEYRGVVPRSEIISEGEFLSRAESLEGYKKCQAGDLVMNIMHAWGTGLGFASCDGIVSPAYSVFRLLHQEDSPRFFGYLLRSREYVSEFRRWSYGIGDSRLRLYPKVFLRLQILTPSSKEQHAIAAFLDRETSKIDTLVAKKERLIELLHEKRTTLITRAVTKGLDPSVSTKDSGVEWLGEIPAHWKILHLRRVIRKFVDYRGKTPEKTPSGVPLVTARNIKNQTIDFSLSDEFVPEDLCTQWMVRGLPEHGDVLVTTEAPLGESAQIDDPNIALAQRIILLKTDNTKIANEYLKYHFASDSGRSELWSKATGSTALGIKASHLKATLIAVPPLSEQEGITSYIDDETTKVDSMILKIREGIDHLKEFRIALISAAVTGKIDVREGPE